MSGPCPTRLDDQRGALFGLDARLAIGVFALIAVIAGYIAFGRIETAKTAALVADVQAVEDALKAYQADMGTFYLFTISKEDNDTGIKDMEALWDVKRVLPGFREHWNGPYLQRETRQHRYFGRFSLIYAQADRVNYCTTDSKCYVWIALTKVPADDWKTINRLLDEGGGTFHEKSSEEISTGRIQADQDVDPRTLFYRTEVERVE